MSLESKIPVAFDFEGPLANPAIDFAWMTFNDLVSSATKEKFSKERIEEFDLYDDIRWEYERSSQGHSTGTTPLICDYVAVIDGVTDQQLIAFARRKVELNKGVEGLVRNLMASGPFYIVTNSHPALSLVTAEQHSIPLKDVFTHGRQIHGGRVERIQTSLEKEVAARSPLSALAQYNKDELRLFLDKYLAACAEILREMQGNTPYIKNAIDKHDALFNLLSHPLGEEMAHQLLNEEAITGGHNKTRILRRIAPDGNVVFIGDSIVDADAIEFAR